MDLNFNEKVHAVRLSPRAYGDIEYKQRKNWNARNRIQRERANLMFDRLHQALFNLANTTDFSIFPRTPNGTYQYTVTDGFAIIYFDLIKVSDSLVIYVTEFLWPYKKDPNSWWSIVDHTIRINQIISETTHKHLNNILTESQESKSIDAAKKLYMQHTGSSREQADEFVRIKLRNDLPILRKPNPAKFILGVTRMFLDRQITDARIISSLNTTLEYVASDTHINEYDRNLNGLSAQELIQRFAKTITDDFEKSKSEIDSMTFGNESNYDIVRIDSFEEASQYEEYTSWCVTYGEDMFNSYTNDGIGQFYFCLRKGFEKEKEIATEGCPLDSYGLSMIAVSVDENGRLNTCTCRWNHANGGNDSIMNPKQISEVIGMNFYEVFKPNNKWKDLLKSVKQRLANRENPHRIFDFVSDFYFVSPSYKEWFAEVKLKEKWNLINTNGELLWKSDEWFDRCCIFFDGFARIELNNKWNFLNTDGEFLWKGEWFDYAFNFSKGTAEVKFNGKEYALDTNGKLHELNESKERTLRLTESEFRELIKESVKETLYNLRNKACLI